MPEINLYSNVSADCEKIEFELKERKIPYAKHIEKNICDIYPAIYTKIGFIEGFDNVWLYLFGGNNAVVSSKSE